MRNSTGGDVFITEALRSRRLGPNLYFYWVSPDSLRQFPNDTALLDGLLAKRFQAEFGSHPGIADMIKKRGLETQVDVIFPIEDDAISFAACAFRKEDMDLHAAFQRELRALKASGEFAKVVSGYGFDVNQRLLTATPEIACTF